MDEASHNKAVADAVAKFPAEFGLTAFPSKTFRIDPRSSYFSLSKGVQVVVQVKNEGEWMDFTRDDADAVQRQVVEKKQ
jgi:hypothetical protein